MSDPSTGSSSARSTASTVSGSRATLADCVRAATAAPSLHNSQPWLFRIGVDHVDVYADRRRQLEVLDPDGRELLISVGSAVFTLRLAIRRTGRLPGVQVFPDPEQADLVARVTVGAAEAPTTATEALADAIARRHTNRWPFARSVVPPDLLEQLATAAQREGADLTVAGAVSRDAILGLSRVAEHRLQTQRGYRAELALWAHPGGVRHDGIPPTAIGPWDALETMPVRDFGMMTPHVQRPAERFEPYPTIAVLATDGDGPRQWVQAGQALQRVLLTATCLGLATTPISQPVEVPGVRAVLANPEANRWAQMVVRLGYGQPAPATPRRPLAEVLLTD